MRDEAGDEHLDAVVLLKHHANAVLNLREALL
jgi:hypothetical protein